MSVTTGGRRNNHTEAGVGDPFIRRGYWVDSRDGLRAQPNPVR